MNWKINKCDKGLKGELVVPPDKSISHRAIMFGSIATGDVKVRNFLLGEDCMRTYEAFRAMGVDITRQESDVIVKGRGLRGLSEPDGDLYLGNSGTTMRVISGILAGQDFPVTLTGDESLSSRPMDRIVDPLKEMGANVGTSGGGRPPIKIDAATGALKSIDYSTPVASAQVKSCILAAGLYASGKTFVTEPFQSRDHTERILEYFSADIERKGLTTTITGLKELSGKDIEVPGDLSSAAFFIVGALLTKGSDIILKNVGLNSTRDGIIKVLKRMGADIEVLEVRGDVEPEGDLRVRSSELKGTVIEADEVPLLIDEVPVLIIAAAMAKGPTEIRGIAELKVKETDRVRSMSDNLSKFGAGVREEGETLVVEGGRESFNSAHLESFGDHRIAMSMAIASLVSNGKCTVEDVACVETSYPGFISDLEALRA